MANILESPIYLVYIIAGITCYLFGGIFGIFLYLISFFTIFILIFLINRIKPYSISSERILILFILPLILTVILYTVPFTNVFFNNLFQSIF